MLILLGMTVDKIFLSNSHSVYYYAEPWKTNFDISSGAANIIFNGFWIEPWYPGSTCESTPVSDPLE